MWSSRSNLSYQDITRAGTTRGRIFASRTFTDDDDDDGGGTVGVRRLRREGDKEESRRFNIGATHRHAFGFGGFGEMRLTKNQTNEREKNPLIDNRIERLLLPIRKAQVNSRHEGIILRIMYNLVNVWGSKLLNQALCIISPFFFFLQFVPQTTTVSPTFHFIEKKSWENGK